MSSEQLHVFGARACSWSASRKSWSSMLDGVNCYRCNHHRFAREEKKTDVNMAVRLLEDAYDNFHKMSSSTELDP